MGDAMFAFRCCVSGWLHLHPLNRGQVRLLAGIHQHAIELLASVRVVNQSVTRTAKRLVPRVVIGDSRS